MICRFCGTQQPEDSIYCNKCGKQLQEAAPKESFNVHTESSATAYDKPPEPVKSPMRADRSPYDQAPQPVKKSGKRWIVLCAALCLLIAGGLATWRVWNTLTVKESSDPVQADWSEWMDLNRLPDYVTEENYEIQEKTFYRSCECETTSSTSTDSMDGWDLYDTKENYIVSDEPFSDWQETAIDESEICEVMTKTQYLYKIKETVSSSSSSLPGWTYYDSETSRGSWSAWSSAPISASSKKEVEKRVRLAHYCIVYHANSYKFDDHCSYHELGWFTSFDDFKNLTDNAFVYYPNGFHNICYTCSNSCGQYYIMETQYRSRDIYTTFNFYKWTEQEWSDEEVSQTDTRELIDTRTLYAYRDRMLSTTYYFKRLCDEWSDWSEQPIMESDTLHVERQVRYSYKSKT